MKGKATVVVTAVANLGMIEILILRKWQNKEKM
jgi:hypothetical protein